jgi:DNA (cytosine-5)-methyltransferase 1
MAGLVLSLFPGIGLLDIAFEEEGFCVVRGPDLLWGGDIRRFHPPAGRFDGVIGGPPCQFASQLRHIVEANGFKVAENLIPEYERVVGLARPEWFCMENVPAAPLPNVEGYQVRDVILCDLWVGGATQRERRFSFGTPDGRALHVETLALHPVNGEPAVTCDMRRRPVALGGSGKPKRRPNESGGRTSSLNRGYGAESLDRMAELQGASDLLAALREPGALTAKGLKTGIGNGVPRAMARAVARAVKAALGTAWLEEVEAFNSPEAIARRHPYLKESAA